MLIIFGQLVFLRGVRSRKARQNYYEKLHRAAGRIRIVRRRVAADIADGSGTGCADHNAAPV